LDKKTSLASSKGTPVSNSQSRSGQHRSARTRLSAHVAGIATAAVVATAALAGSVATAESATAASCSTKDAVTWIQCEGIAKGYANGSFGARQPVTRAEVAAMLFRQVGPDYVRNGQRYFKDVPAGTYYTEPVAWMAQAGITEGYSGRTYGPGQKISRGELAAFLYRLAGSPSTSSKATFKDVPAGKYYTKPVTWMSANKLVSGYKDRTFRPDQPVTRGEVAKMLMTSNPKVSGRGNVSSPRMKPLSTTVERASSTTTGWKGKAISWATTKAKSSTTYYQYGGNGPNGFDCSGFTTGAFAAGGESLPRTSKSQFTAADQKVPLSQAKPGDLVYWSNNGNGTGVYHVAIVVEGGKIAHARNPTSGVTLTNLNYSQTNMLPQAGRFN
jgi:cell wall-associated NlpC family hydrolase